MWWNMEKLNEMWQTCKYLADEWAWSNDSVDFIGAVMVLRVDNGAALNPGAFWSWKFLL